jgi:hypothetical protein
MATEAPALRWFEPEVFDVPEVLGPHLARCLVAQAAHAHVVLRDPPPWLEAALEAAVSARAETAPLRAERITVELGDGPSAMTPEKFGSLTGLSPVP